MIKEIFIRIENDNRWDKAKHFIVLNSKQEKQLLEIVSKEFSISLDEINSAIRWSEDIILPDRVYFRLTIMETRMISRLTFAMSNMDNIRCFNAQEIEEIQKSIKSV